MSTFTADQVRRIHDAIAECDRTIAKEMAYSERHRNAQRIVESENHKVKMLALLERGFL